MSKESSGIKDHKSQLRSLRNYHENHGNNYCVLSYLCGRIQSINLQKGKSMIEISHILLERLAYEIADLHNVGGIELEQWDTAYQFVKHYYNTEEQVQIIIGSKKV